MMTDIEKVQKFLQSELDLHKTIRDSNQTVLEYQSISMTPEQRKHLVLSLALEIGVVAYIDYLIKELTMYLERT